MEHLEGMNYQIIHELLLAEMKRMDTNTSTYYGQWWLDELNRMNKIAVEEAEKQA